MDEKTLAQVSKIVDDAVGVVADSIADAFEGLGCNGAETKMGAIETLADAVHKGSAAIAESIGDLAEAIRERNKIKIEEKKYVAKG